MKVGFIFECSKDGPDVKGCRHFLGRLKPELELIPRTMDNKPNLIELCGAVAKELLKECSKVAIIWDLYPAWREKGIRPCLHEDRVSIFQALNNEEIDLTRVVLVCIQEELEAWLVADNRAVASMIAPLKRPYPVSRIKNYKKPDRIRNPKAKLTRVFNQELGATHRYVDYQHAVKIAEQVPDFQKIRRSDSFKRFALKITCTAF